MRLPPRPHRQTTQPSAMRGSLAASSQSSIGPSPSTAPSGAQHTIPLFKQVLSSLCVSPVSKEKVSNLHARIRYGKCKIRYKGINPCLVVHQQGKHMDCSLTTTLVVRPCVGPTPSGLLGGKPDWIYVFSRFWEQRGSR